MTCSPASWRGIWARIFPVLRRLIVQDLPAASGLVMANQLYALGPNDGTAIGVPINGIPAAPLLQGAAARFDATRLSGSADQ